ncbi:MAG TPA: twin-arginine translocase TatA/TatE family subunit [Acidimicrobiia bacterium]|nr:twin-arginine translocase TatA/TatE family subunit [Acidimicrobiia bacterium]
MGTQELLIILVIVLLIFGARKLPDLARSLGSSAKEFRKGIEEGAGEDEDPTVTHTSELPPSDSKEVPDS